MTIFTVAAEDILGENYELTKMECSDYNPNIDDSITLTITVTDVYGDAISGESVLVTASAGNFTKYNGSTITGASSYTGTTNSSGQFTLTYSCSEWGLITFSANTVSSQIMVTGFRQIANNTTYTLYADESRRVCKVYGHRTGVTINSGDSFSGYGDFEIPSKYRPNASTFCLIMKGTQFSHYIDSDGTYGIRNNGSQVTNYSFNFVHEYHF